MVPKETVHQEASRSTRKAAHESLQTLLRYVLYEKQDGPAINPHDSLKGNRDGDQSRDYGLPRSAPERPQGIGRTQGLRSIESLHRLRVLPGRHLDAGRDGGTALLLQAYARSHLLKGRDQPAPSVLRSTLKAPRYQHEIRGERVGGTLFGDERQMARQALPFLQMRPGIAAPIVHYSLSLSPEDGSKSLEQWGQMVDAFLTKMGFPLHGAWVAFRHQDTDHEHVHIALVRSLGDGKLWDRQFSAKRAIAACAELEREFNLHVHDRRPKLRQRSTRGEQELQQRLQQEGKKLSKEHIRQAGAEALEKLGQGFSFEQLKQQLEAHGVSARLSSAKGKLQGISLEYQGVPVPGSAAGLSKSILVERGMTWAQAGQDAPLADEVAVHLVPDVPVVSQAQALAEPVVDPAQEAFSSLASAVTALPAALIKLMVLIVNWLIGRAEALAGRESGAYGRLNDSFTLAGGVVAPDQFTDRDLAARQQLAGQFQQIEQALERREFDLLPETPHTQDFIDAEALSRAGAGQASAEAETVQAQPAIDPAALDFLTSFTPSMPQPEIPSEPEREPAQAQGWHEEPTPVPVQPAAPVARMNLKSVQYYEKEINEARYKAERLETALRSARYDVRAPASEIAKEFMDRQLQSLRENQPDHSTVKAYDRHERALQNVNDRRSELRMTGQGLGDLINRRRREAELKAAERELAAAFTAWKVERDAEWPVDRLREVVADIRAEQRQAVSRYEVQLEEVHQRQAQLKTDLEAARALDVERQRAAQRYVPGDEDSDDSKKRRSRGEREGL